MAQKAGQIGGKPTDAKLRDCKANFGGPAQYKVITKAALVIGAGVTPLGRYEIVACGTKTGPCLTIDPVGRPGAVSTCLSYSYFLPPDGSFRIDMAAKQRGVRKGFLISGPITPKVAKIVTKVRRRKHRGFRRRSAILAQPPQDLLDKLKIDRPFAYFASVMRGCPRSKRVRSLAFGAGGERVGLIRGNDRICQRIPGVLL
jgi:hypothetical protein